MRAGPVWLVFWLALGACSSASGEGHKPTPANVFLVTIDTLRADHVHCYGYTKIKTPALDQLAENGISFAQAFTPSPITNSSHATILTGLLPSSHRVTDFAIPLAATHATWAELLKPRGYRTAAFIGAVILDSRSLAPGLDRGFDYYDNFPEHAQTRARWGRIERRGMDVVRRAETWLSAHPANPHFLWVHLYDPHDPYEPPPPYSETYKDRLYDGEIAYADSALANFLAYLKRRGWYKDALIIVVGDHGEGLGEHGEDTHGIFLYDSTTHVPLIIKLAANVNSGQVMKSQVRTTDILPTVLDVLGVRVPSGLDGESLVPYFGGTQKSDQVVFGETDYPLRFGWAPLRSLRTPEFKFIEAPRPELYNLKRDPAESENDYAPWDQTVQKLRAMLADRRAKAPTAGASPAAVPDNTINELKALGYLGRADVGSSTNVPEPSLLPDPKDKIREANLLHKAMMASESDRTAEARAALEQVLEVDPKSPTALRQLGELELNTGDFARAAEHFKAAREVRSDDATAAYYEGQAREKTQDWAGARDALQASLKLVPGQLRAHLLLGDIYLRLKNPGAADDQFEAALLLDARSVEARLGVARAEMAEGDADRALGQLEPLASSIPKNPEVYDLMAQAYRELGKYGQARDAEARATSLRRRTRP
ncbi:MAG: sulfatase-like hydrolase/transferase [Acidobacteria bacterium]|nr:sulfatase-like hydrolase/transferase [Acidobacteriota bacterium]